MHIAQVHLSLKWATLQVNIKKGMLFHPNVTFLVRVFDGQTKTTKQESLWKAESLQKPGHVHRLMVFLGLAGQFRAFIKNCAKHTTCFTEFLHTDTCSSRITEHNEAHSDIVEISLNPVLSILHFRLLFKLCADVSR